jgi:oligopeptide/dipeptide ABC transporter ATP-binding protein
MMGAPAIVELRDVTVLLGGARRWLRAAVPPVRAVGGVSLTVQPGEIIGLVGESGCGKTTLGRTLLGLQRESAGEIRLDGVCVSALLPKAARRRRSAIHYIHQDAAAALDPWWNSGRTLEEGLRIRGIATAAERRVRVDEMLDAVPRLDPSAARPAALQGEPPSAARLPPGCVFSSRCQHAEASCREAEPVLQDDAGHAVACSRWRDIGPAVGGRAKNPVLALA